MCNSGLPPLQRTSPRAMQGVALIVVLMILMIVSLLGVAAVELTLLGERATRYDRDHQIAWQSANAALVDAQMDLENGTRAAAIASAQFVEGCGSSGDNRGLCAFDETIPAPYAVDFADAGNSSTVAFGTFTNRTFSAGDSGLRPALAPRYIIEKLDTSADIEAGNGLSASTANASSSTPVYRITAMGFGPSSNVRVVVQMVYRKSA